MFEQKKSDRQLKKDLEKLEKQKEKMERTDEILTYLAWWKLPAREKYKIRKIWDVYYEKAQKTEAQRDFFMMGKYWNEKKMKKVRELAEKARKRAENADWKLEKPFGIDPWEFSHGVYSKYSFICQKIASLNKKLTGVENPDEVFS